MQKNIRALALSLLFLIGCHENQDFIPVKGTIIGFVKLHDESGLELMDHSGVKVSIDDSHAATTDSIGRFEITDALPGNYQILFEKDGYGYLKKYNYVFAAGNEPAVLSGINLIELPSINLTNIVTGLFDSQTISVSGTISNRSNRYHLIYYLGEHADVSNVNSSVSYEYSFCCSTTDRFSDYVPIASPMSSIYVTAYAISIGNEYNSYSYYDYEENKIINPTVKQLFKPIKIR